MRLSVVRSVRVGGPSAGGSSVNREIVAGREIAWGPPRSTHGGKGAVRTANRSEGARASDAAYDPAMGRKDHQISSEGKDRAGKPLKVLPPVMQKVFGEFGGHISIQRSTPRWVEPMFVDKAIGYLKGLE